MLWGWWPALRPRVGSGKRRRPVRRPWPEHPMVARIWHGRTPAAKADEYRQYLFDVGIKKIASLPGNRGVQMMVAKTAEQGDFTVISYWDLDRSDQRLCGRELHAGPRPAAGQGLSDRPRTAGAAPRSRRQFLAKLTRISRAGHERRDGVSAWLCCRTPPSRTSAGCCSWSCRGTASRSGDPAVLQPRSVGRGDERHGRSRDRAETVSSGALSTSQVQPNPPSCVVSRPRPRQAA